MIIDNMTKLPHVFMATNQAKQQAHSIQRHRGHCHFTRDSHDSGILRLQKLLTNRPRKRIVDLHLVNKMLEPAPQGGDWP